MTGRRMAGRGTTGENRADTEGEVMARIIFMNLSHLSEMLLLGGGGGGEVPSAEES
jgi:hypothetical protein